MLRIGSLMLWYKIITSVFLCFLITGCGFSPVYVKNNKSLFNTQFRYIKIDPIQDRVGQQLRNELVKILHPTGAASPLKYSLSTTISIAKQALAIKKSELATRSNLIVRANFTLTENESKTSITAGNSKIITSYNILEQVYATKVAEQNAQIRAISEISRDIASKLGVFFRYQKKVKR